MAQIENFVINSTTIKSIVYNGVNIKQVDLKRDIEDITIFYDKVRFPTDIVSNLQKDPAMNYPTKYIDNLAKDPAMNYPTNYIDSLVKDPAMNYPTNYIDTYTR